MITRRGVDDCSFGSLSSRPTKNFIHTIATLLLILHTVGSVTASSFHQLASSSGKPEYLSQFLDVTTYPHVVKHMPELNSVKVLELMKWVHLLDSLDPQTHSRPQLLEALSTIHTIVLSFNQPGVSYAVSRRMALGVLLLKKQQLAALWDGEADRLLESICLQLFKLHHAASARRGIVSFLHISKAGGTSMCKIAKANQCSTQSFSFNSNCRIKTFGDFLLWTVKGIKTRDHRVLHPYFSKYNYQFSRDQKQCSVRYRTMKGNNWNFHANELYLPGGAESPAGAHACKNMVNVVLLRDPMERIISHLRYMTRWYKLFKGQWPWGDLDEMMAIAPAVTNNYYIRSLLGKLVYNAPRGAIGRAHLELAKLKLHQFDIVLSLEEVEKSDLVMRTGLGWNKSLDDVHANKQMKRGEQKPDWGLGLNDTQKAELTSFNALDMELFNYTMEVFEVDHQFYRIVSSLAAQGRLEGFAPEGLPGQSCGYAGANRPRPPGPASPSLGAPGGSSTPLPDPQAAMAAQGRAGVQAPVSAGSSRDGYVLNQPGSGEQGSRSGGVSQEGPTIVAYVEETTRPSEGISQQGVDAAADPHSIAEQLMGGKDDGDESANQGDKEAPEAPSSGDAPDTGALPREQYAVQVDLETAAKMLEQQAQEDEENEKMAAAAVM